MNKAINSKSVSTAGATKHQNQGGFSMIEVVISLVIIMIALLGVFAALTYAVTYNAGNKTRSQTLAVMQQEVERYRAAKFNSATTDNFASPADPNLCLTNGQRDLRGRVKSSCRVISIDDLQFIVTSSVDNDPFSGTPDAPEVEGHVCTSPQGDPLLSCAIKEITIEVRLAAPSPGWQTAIPVVTVLRRVKGN